MYCPQCGIESSAGLQYCRSCGANLKVIGKALTLSEAIARSDRGPLPKLKEMVKNIKLDQVTEEVSKALEHMNKEIVNHTSKQSPDGPWWKKRKKTARERREEQITKGAVSFFSGIGIMIFLYYLAGALVLRLPPDFVQKVPFEIEPLVRVIWLFGLLPLTAGVGHIIAGLTIRPDPREDRPQLPASEPAPAVKEWTPSVTERTTNLLEKEL